MEDLDEMELDGDEAMEAPPQDDAVVTFTKHTGESISKARKNLWSLER